MADTTNERRPIGKRLVFWALYGVFALALFLAVIEVGVRVLGIGPSLAGQASLFVPDPHLPYRPQPGGEMKGRSSTDEYDYHFKLNRFGYRDVEHDLEKPAGVFRIVGLGDSFTMGWGATFEETYLRRLEVSLNAREGEHPPVEIVKAGISGYFPETQRMLLEHEGVTFEPDLVLVGFTPNDIYDTYRGVDAVRLAPEGYLTTQEAEALGPVARWLFKYVRASRLPLQRLTTRGQARLKPGWWKDMYRKGGMFDDAWAEVLAQYEAMDRIARDAGAQLAVLNIPTPRKGQPYQTFPGEVLADWSLATGVPVIDALPAMRAAAEREELFWEKDGHCTPAGYSVLAEVLHEELTRRGLVP